MIDLNETLGIARGSFCSNQGALIALDPDFDPHQRFDLCLDRDLLLTTQLIGCPVSLCIDCVP